MNKTTDSAHEDHQKYWHAFAGNLLNRGWSLRFWIESRTGHLSALLSGDYRWNFDSAREMMREECLSNAGSLCQSILVFMLSLAIWAQIFVEPRDGLLQAVGLVLGVDEHMAFAGIDDELCRYAKRF